ncbi:MAG: hypothetical protein U0794_03795 [Isosphaeraceae bacterium]
MEPKTGTTRRTTSATTSAAATTATATPPGQPAQAGGTETNPAWVNRRASAQATRAANARQVSGRRRFVDPTTCERDYSVAEMEFMQAMHEYKQRSGRMFPTWSEVLEVLKNLGYAKIEESALEPASGPVSEVLAAHAGRSTKTAHAV